MNTKRARVVVPAVVIALALVAVGIYRLRTPHERALVASGTVEATEALLGFETPGRIVYVGPHEGDPARRGQVLARLDTATGEAALARAQAFVVTADARHAQARRDLARGKALLRGKVIGAEAYDQRRLALEVARGDAVRAAAEVAQARAVLDGMIVRAPFGGVVTARDHEPGEVVGAGVPVLTLMNPADRWVRIYIAEDKIGTVHLGERARITTDSFPGKPYAGRVIYVAPDAEFTPKDVQTREERVRLVYAVKVRIDGDARLDLKPGLPADVRLEGP